MSTSSWVLLGPHLGAEGSDANYFVKYSFESESYKVSLTDLVHVWCEALSRRELVKRALVDNIAIDLTEGRDQVQRFLEIIKRPLIGDGKMELQLSRLSGDIVLHTTASLQPPLHTLEWSYQLSREPDEALSKELIAPLWLDGYQKTMQTEELIKKITEKDHVISKLLDSIESAHIDLSTIFPSTAGLRTGKTSKMRMDQAGAMVPGLGPFRTDEWKAMAVNDLPSIHGSTVAITDQHLKLFKAILNPDQDISSAIDARENTAVVDRTKAHAPDSHFAHVPVDDNAEQADQGSETDDDATESENEFQTQETPSKQKFTELPPPPPVTKAPSPSSFPSSNASLDVPPSPAAPRRLNRGKLGRVGGAARKTPEEGSQSSKTVDGHDSDGDDKPQQTSPKMPKKLGKVGGLKKASAKNTESTTSRASEASPEPSHLRDNAGSRDSMPGSENRRQDAKATSVHQNATHNNVEETPEELAERRREELKRRLESDQKAPAKKKKRF